MPRRERAPSTRKVAKPKAKPATAKARIKGPVSATKVRLRPTSAIVDRAMALFCVSMRAKNAPAAMQEDFARRFGGMRSLSPAERRFMATKAPDPRARIQLSWRVEALNVLLWSVGIVDAVGKPNELAHPLHLLAPVLVHENVAGLHAAARRRPVEAVSELAERMYQAHWSIRDAGLKGKRAPRGLHPGVVMERDYACRWLTMEGNRSWDNVTTDT